MITYEMIKESGKRVHLAGNIGYPLTSFLDKLEDNDIIVMEVSCQQLENLSTFHPHIAVMTNLFEAHIDFFGDFRSVNGQIEYLLTECVKQRKKNGKYVSDTIDEEPEFDIR